MEQVHRYATSADLTEAAADRLVRRIVDLQAEPGRVVQLCLSGGRIANRIYEAFTDLVDDAGLDPARIELWWGDERFVPTEDPERHAGVALAILARRLTLSPGATHPMASSDGISDNAVSAAQYAKELDDTVFDICLLGIGVDGQVAALFPDHPSFEQTSHTVIAVTASPKPPASRISLTIEAINRSHEVWFLVAGEEKAAAVARSVAGDPGIPAGVARGTDETLWLVDRAAAEDLPYHACSF